MNIFQDGQPIDLETVLANKDWRTAFQTQLEKQYPDDVVVSVKLNIPGPIKNSPGLQQLFQQGLNRLRMMLGRLHVKDIKFFVARPSGPETFLIVSEDITTVKRVAVLFESDMLTGRLFDVDVMAYHNEKQLSRQALGLPARQCLICDKDAKVCMKLGAHTLTEGYQVINQLYKKMATTPLRIWPQTQAAVVQYALSALLYEVSVNPKPGLVDPVSNGAHDDMTVFTFIDSSLALTNYFNQAYRIGLDYSGGELTSMFQMLRKAGIAAEKQMFVATHGINTHKGAIFSLGILVTAIAYISRQGVASLQQLQQVVQGMLQGIVTQDLNHSFGKRVLTAGEKQYQAYQLTGVRGEAAAGFPTVMAIALPFLQQASGTTNQKLLDTLMVIADNINDTNLIKRAGTIAIIPELKQWISHYFELGGSVTPEGLSYLYTLDEHFMTRNLSIGGAADNLILTTFLAKMGGIL